MKLSLPTNDHVFLKHHARTALQSSHPFHTAKAHKSQADADRKRGEACEDVEPRPVIVTTSGEDPDSPEHDTLPHTTADALRAPTSGPLNGPAKPSAPQPLIEVLAELNINSSPHQQTDVEMAPAGHVLGPANGNPPPADMPTDLAQADHYQPASLEDAEVTASAANVEVEGRRRDHNAGGAGEQVDKEAEATSGDVDMTVDPVAEDCRDGEVGQADPCIEATPTDVAGQSDVGVSMSQAAAGEVGQADPSIEATPTDVAHQPDVGVSMSQAGAGGQLGSLEDGQLPQDQLGLSTCTSPPAQAADSAL